MKLKSPVLFSLLFFTSAALAQPTARVVRYHANDIVPIEARMRYTTLIELPATEKIMVAATGDKDFRIIDALGNYCFLHPAKDGLHSNLNLITDKGNVYSFTLDEDATTPPDLKVVIVPSDPSAIAQAFQAPRFLPASQVLMAEKQTQAAEKHAQESIEEFRSEYPTKSLQFDYYYKNKKPFDIAAIYHDGQFTYIRTKAPEKFAVYELQDGKPDLINFQLKSRTGQATTVRQSVQKMYQQTLTVLHCLAANPRVIRSPMPNAHCDSSRALNRTSCLRAQPFRQIAAALHEVLNSQQLPMPQGCVPAPSGFEV